MNISIQRDVHICVSKYLAQAFDIEAELNASCCKSVPKSMKIQFRYSALVYYGLEPIFHTPRFDIASNHPRK